MKRSWLVVVGAIALVVIGSIFVVMSSGDDSRRQGALGSPEAVPLSWQGDWSAEAEYSAGSVVSHEGTSYVAEGEKLGTPEAGCAGCGWTQLVTESPPAEAEEPAPAEAGRQDMYTAYTPRGSTFTSADTLPKAIEGLSLDVNVPASSVLYVSTDGRVWDAGGGAAFVAEISIHFDGGYAASAEIGCPQGQSRGCSWSRALVYHLSPGKHTIDVKATHISGGSFTLGGGPGGTIAPNVATLNVIVLKTM